MSKRRRLLKAEETSMLLLQQLADECLDASSSDEDDDDTQIYANKSEELFAEPLDVPKVNGYVRNVVSNYSDKQFRSNFRLARSACYNLIKQFEESEFFPSDRSHGGVPVKTSKEHILSFLWYAVNKASMREVAVLFDMAESTQFAVIDRVLGFLCQIAPDIIHFGLDKDALARDFQELAGFQGVIGCIDGTYIPMRYPANKIRSMYINRHDECYLNKGEPFALPQSTVYWKKQRERCGRDSLPCATGSSSEVKASAGIPDSVSSSLCLGATGYVRSRESSSADLADEDDALIADYSFVNYREADVPDAETLQRTEHVPSAASDDEVLSDCSESFESDTSDGETGEEAAAPRSTFLDEPE
ncbi:hypothetical protein HPB50_019093 [Hyalomma asiaticum]|uniref:Uncharacterized protein n=1 Tax=Hyalomma asiaticum TaxID=266040 RepID=A0ACB7SG50_HYAAI|nr:hypothetical protein HPB50_019093 [Hyalomma asiaticum]